MLKTNLGRLRALAILEGVSYLALFGITMPLKYMLDMPGPNQWVGMIHGFLFIAYCLWVLIVKQEYRWGLKKTVLSLLASLIPFGTFIADKKWFRDPYAD